MQDFLPTTLNSETNQTILCNLQIHSACFRKFKFPYIFLNWLNLSLQRSNHDFMGQTLG